ncbi:MAG: hypothetical protein M5U34_07375 [Chloroflexi bacterium]|nr:hypothetical protein [Chloroflexota bacterium]
MTEFIPSAYIEEAATAVRKLTRYQPTIGLVLGSGLSDLADEIEAPDSISYEDIPIGLFPPCRDTPAV